MLGQEGFVSVGVPVVHMTTGRGFTPEELAIRCTDKIVAVSATADPMVQAQAHAFKAQVHSVVLAYLRQAVLSEHTTLLNKFIAAGQPELAAFLSE